MGSIGGRGSLGAAVYEKRSSKDSNGDIINSKYGHQGTLNQNNYHSTPHTAYQASYPLPSGPKQHGSLHPTNSLIVASPDDLQSPVDLVAESNQEPSQDMINMN